VKFRPAVAPAIFTLDQQGTGAGAIQHGISYQVVTDSNPAAAGEIISIYCTGLGALDPFCANGRGAAGSRRPQIIQNGAASNMVTVAVR
jgi:uncharacterized protein (TIGR03437 family)